MPIVAQPNSSASRTAAMYILHCCSDLILGQFGFLVRAPFESHAFLQQPSKHVPCFGVADLLHRGKERGLAEAFLENAGGMEQFIGNNGVEHAHAAFVKHAHDGFFVA